MNNAANLGIAINGGAVVTRTLSIGAGLQHATVSLDLTHWGDLSVELIALTGTISKLVANPGTNAKNAGSDVGSRRTVEKLQKLNTRTYELCGVMRLPLQYKEMATKATNDGYYRRHSVAAP